MENGLNYMAVQFAMQLVKRYLLDEKLNSPVNESDLYNTVETLVKINTHTQGTAPDGYVWLSLPSRTIRAGQNRG